MVFAWSCVEFLKYIVFLVWRIQTIIIVKHLLVSLQHVCVLVSVLVEHHLVTDHVPGLGTVGARHQRTAGDDVDGGGGGGGGGGRGARLHPQLLSQARVQGGGAEHGHEAAPAHVHCPGGGGGAGRGGAGGRRVLAPLVHAAAPRVHEEVGDCGGVETELSGDGDLHLFRGTLGLLKHDTSGGTGWLDGHGYCSVALDTGLCLLLLL